MKIYTKTGDKGETSLVGGQRVPKDDPRIETVGTIDELNATIGLAISLLPPDQLEIGAVLSKVQHHLLNIGSELAGLSDLKTDQANQRGDQLSALAIPKLTAANVSWLEQGIDACEEELSPLKNFILPGGAPAASALHLARTICRRAERRLTKLRRLLNFKNADFNDNVLKYLNRLSDFLFNLARLVNARTNQGDVTWQKN